MSPPNSANITMALKGLLSLPCVWIYDFDVFGPFDISDKPIHVLASFSSGKRDRGFARFELGNDKDKRATRQRGFHRLLELFNISGRNGIFDSTVSRDGFQVYAA